VLVYSLVATPRATSGWAQEPAAKFYVFRKSAPIVDLSREEVRRAWPEELMDVAFDDNQEQLRFLVSRIGENAETFFRDFPNTTSSEQVREERISASGKAQAHVNREFSYLVITGGDDPDAFEENRVEKNGKPAKYEVVPGFFRTTGFATSYVFFRPHNQREFRFRYLGRQTGEPHAHLIAFEQDEHSRLLGTFNMGLIRGLDFAYLVYQGLIWVDPDNYHILRIMMTVAATVSFKPHELQVRTDVWFSPVSFPSMAGTFWLPREVHVLIDWSGTRFRNRHLYSDYKVFSVESFEKREKPVKP